MTDQEKIEMVKTMCEETDTGVVSAYLTLAEQKICRLAYPYDHEVTTVPERYEMTQVEWAVYLLNKRGGEGETAHSENGVSRTYEDAGIPASMMREIVPFCGVIQ